MASKHVVSNYRIEITPFYYGFENPTPQKEKSDCEAILEQIKRHLDDCKNASIECDEGDICEFCESTWETDDDGDGAPMCCEAAIAEWQAINFPTAEPPNWETALQHFKGVQHSYRSLENTPGFNTTLALVAVFNPLEQRYNSGERTQELYDAMMEVE